MKEFMFSGVSKTHKKTLKGYLIVIKTKAYIINPKYITRYINADYIWLEGGAEKHEVDKNTIEMLRDNA